MKANELQIGNWVTGKKWRENPFKITRINDNGKYYYGITSDGARVGPFLIEEIEPIPLTPEILEKNGFKIISKGVYVYYSSAADGYIKIRLCDLLDGEWELYVDDYEKFNDSHYTFTIDRCFLKVHQLQHALRLGGITREIIL
jgi:hypothetical protein